MKNKTRRPLLNNLVFVALLLLSLFSARPAYSTSVQANKRTPHFHFTYPTRWKRIAHYLWTRAEKDLQELEKDTGYALKEVLRVRLATGGRSFSNIQPGRWQPHAWIAGLAYPKKGLMTVKIRPVDGPSGIHQTFRHELSHLLLAKASQHHTLPLWFVEGVAMIQSQDYGIFDRYLMLSQAHLSGNLPDIENLAHRFPSGATAAQLAYATSTEFLLFLKREHPHLLPGLLKRIRKGTPFRKALTLQTDRSWRKIRSMWKEHLSYHYSWIPLLSSSSILWLLLSLLFLFVALRLKKQRQFQMKLLEASSPPNPPKPFIPFIPTSPQLPNGNDLFDRSPKTPQQK